MERVQQNSSYINAMSTTGTRTRVRDVNPQSGMCPLCVSDCLFVCEIALSAFRANEALYPDPKYFGESTASSLKDYGLDWCHFNIMSRVTGAEGIEADPDVAIFPNASVESKIGKTKVRFPLALGAYGSTEVARRYWEGLAVGAALAGCILIVGENVCGVDPRSEFKDGKVVRSPEMERRIKTFKEFWDGKYGDIVVQVNVEDTRFGVYEYVLSKLEVNTVEIKWGQGAKAIGGEIRVKDLQRAIELKKRGYIVLPDPEDPVVQEALKSGTIDSFERHSRVGMPTEKSLEEFVEELRKLGAKNVTIKTGAYRPADVAWQMKVASEAEVDYVTFDGAGGGTGMSPVPMMNEMGIPTVYLEALVLKAARILKKKGRYVPDISIAGGFINETQIFKAIAMSNFGEGPMVKTVTIGRAPLTAVMKAEYFVKLAKDGKLPKSFVETWGDKPEKFFVLANEFKSKFKDLLGTKLPWSAVALYSYIKRMEIGMKQLLAGVRKFRLDLIDRDDLAALTPLASEVTGIPMIHKLDNDVFENILS
ncbi:MAG: glutamate synthase-related protein [Archaeoglobaceae archaeon]|nr:glutamate synthase-related protein [Archaeoglobaceae archaeon]